MSPGRGRRGRGRRSRRPGRASARALAGAGEVQREVHGSDPFKKTEEEQKKDQGRPERVARGGGTTGRRYFYLVHKPCQTSKIDRGGPSVRRRGPLPRTRRLLPIPLARVPSASPPGLRRMASSLCRAWRAASCIRSAPRKPCGAAEGQRPGASAQRLLERTDLPGQFLRVNVQFQVAAGHALPRPLDEYGAGVPKIREHAFRIFACGIRQRATVRGREPALIHRPAALGSTWFSHHRSSILS